MSTNTVALSGLVLIAFIVYYAYTVHTGKVKIPESKKRGVYLATLFASLFIAFMTLNLYYRFL